MADLRYQQTQQAQQARPTSTSTRPHPTHQHQHQAPPHAPAPAPGSTPHTSESGNIRWPSPRDAALGNILYDKVV